MTVKPLPRGYPRDDLPACMYWPIPEPGEVFDVWQDNRCALCGWRPPMVTDHDHETGLIRGSLCYSCNNAEARRNDPALVAWRSGRNPATILGHEEIYFSSWSD